jgi:hypothetical protein
VPLRIKAKKRNGRLRALLIACATLAIALPGGTAPTSAIPIPSKTPGPVPSETPAPPTTGDTLPFGSNVFLALDDPVSSKTAKPGQIVRVHLKYPLVVDGVTIARAGAPAQMLVLAAKPAGITDEYGSLDVSFGPLTLAGGASLPLAAPQGHLTVKVSAGHESTVQTEDTIEDIIFPAALLYQIFRKGRNVTLGVGSVVRARSVAAVTVLPGKVIAVSTPRPIELSAEAPAADFIPLPLAHGMPGMDGGRRGRRAPPTETPYPIPSETPYPQASSQPSQAPATPTPSPGPSYTPFVSETPYHG